jgi:UDP-N-acetylmuramoyl-L-alanyl-D-glutamate--2,6-diaminopimelate ligase
MKPILKLLKNILGKNLTNKIRPLGHGIKSWLAALYFGFPAKKLKLIGITSTKGKTTTTIITGRLMNLSGLKTGYISTALINTDGNPQNEVVNSFKMTTIDGFWLQKYLKDMVNNGCEYVVLEMSSQGLEQNRHWGLGKFLVGMFMNLYPEHIEAHGSWENYQKAKSIMFQNIDSYGFFIASVEPKQLENTEFIWNSINPEIRKTISKIPVSSGEYQILDEDRSFYKILIYKGKKLYTNFIADFEVENLVYAIKTVEIFKHGLVSDIQNLLSKLSGKIPGRMEFVIKDNQVAVEARPIQITTTYQSSVSILVDYAHEPKSVEKLLENLVDWKTKGYYTDIIHILSSDGAGRDDWKKPLMGEISFRNSDYTIATTDNYDANDSPNQIVDLLTQNLPQDKIFTKDPILENLDEKKVIKEIDRRQAFKDALTLAKLLMENKDRPEVTTDFYRKIVIVSTGVGSEYGITQPSGTMEWDERQVWLEEYNKAFEV